MKKKCSGEQPQMQRVFWCIFIEIDLSIWALMFTQRHTHTQIIHNNTEKWYGKLYDMVWDEFESGAVSMTSPYTYQTIQLLKNNF